MNDEYVIRDIKPAYMISVYNPEKKCLNIDFNGDKVILTGDLECDEAAKILFEHMHSYFKGAIEEEVRKRLKEHKLKEARQNLGKRWIVKFKHSIIILTDEYKNFNKEDIEDMYCAWDDESFSKPEAFLLSIFDERY